MVNPQSKAPRRLLLIALTLVFVAALGVTFYWIYQRGLTREGLLERAQRAYREARFDDAINLATETLAAEPENIGARELMIEALISADREKEARTHAASLLKDHEDSTFAAVKLCQFALQDSDIPEAERLARHLADRKPDFAYQVLALIQDHRGLATHSWRARLAAAATMRGLAALVDKEAIKAEAYLFSATVSLEVAPLLPQSEGLVAQVRKDLKQAVTFVSAARQQSRSYEYDYAMGRIRILSDDPKEAEMGAQTLRRYTSGVRRQTVAIAELAKYHLRREEWSEALDQIRELDDGYLWNRVFFTLRSSPHHDIAIKVLEFAPVKDNPEHTLLEAEVVFQGNDANRKQQLRAELVEFMRDKETETGFVLRALLMLALRSDLQTARAAAEAADVQSRGDARITAFLASLLSADEKDKEKGLELARKLALETHTGAESRDVMRFLAGNDGEALSSYLDAQIGKGGSASLQHRLQRAMTLLARSRKDKDSDQAAEMRKRVVEDVRALAENEETGKADLVLAFNLAAALGEAEMSGTILGRALLLEGPPEMMDIRVLRLSLALTDDAVRQRLADGLRGVARTARAQAYLNTFADAIASRAQDRIALLKKLEEAAAEEGSRRLALGLAARIALGEGDLDTASRLAREAWNENPKDTTALELLAAVMLQRKQYEDVVALYKDLEVTPEIGSYQIVGALMALKRKDEALARARDVVARYPKSIMAHVLLARVYLDNSETAKNKIEREEMRRDALSVLNMAPSNPYVAHMRAGLLREFGDLDMAERLYQVLLVNSKFTDVQAWMGLKDTLQMQKRVNEFVELSQRILESKFLVDDRQTRAIVHYLRGVGLEFDGKIHDALADYEAAIKADSNIWFALNNAAWHIAKHVPARVAHARAYIDHALKLRPKEASLLDTAAEVSAVQGDLKGAVLFMDQAIALHPKGRIARYSLHKADILVRFDKDDEARDLADRVRRENAGKPIAKQARDLLWKIERKHLPEDKPLDFEMPKDPEDEEDTAEEGAED